MSNPPSERHPKTASRQAGAVNFPLAALVGQEKMKTALFLLAVDPRLGGILLVGQKGTAKSTAVRSLAEILPELEVVKGCAYNCDPRSAENFCPECRGKVKADEKLETRERSAPFYTLPLGATEDRVAGGIDIEKSIARGRPIVKPGLLGQANRGFLYVDEVNLLEPYLAHLLLDAAESGVVYVEREGISIWHPARAALIGTMNPEEGALGPQLADRFALTVNVSGESDPKLRTEIIRRRLDFEKSPEEFRKKWAGKTEELTRRIIKAKQSLHGLEITEKAGKLIADLSWQSLAMGHRADIAIARAARAQAAWQGDESTTEDHVLRVAELALHSRTRQPKQKRTEVTIVQGDVDASAQHFETPYIPPNAPEPPPPAATGDGPTDQPVVERIFGSNQSFELITPNLKREQGPRGRSGRRSARQTREARGRYYRYSMERLGRPVALDATLRAAAPHQARRRKYKENGFIIKNQDVREKVYRKKTGRLVLFVVDASGSVGSLNRMSEAKSAVMSLLSDAYQKRDRVGMLCFHGTRAKVLLPPTNSVEMAGRLLEELPTGGKTPMAAALVCTHDLISMEMAKDPGLTPLIIIMTDGRPNIPLNPAMDPWREVLQMAGQMAQDARLRFLLVDTDQGYYNDYKLTHDLADRLRAPRLTLEDLRQGKLDAWLENVA